MSSRDTELIWEAYKSSSRPKIGDIASAANIMDYLNIQIDKFKKSSFGSGTIIDGYMDPSGTFDNRIYKDIAGNDLNAAALYDEKLEEFANKVGVPFYKLDDFYTSIPHTKFIPKCKKLADIAIESITAKSRGKMSPEEAKAYTEGRSKGYAESLFPYIGIASPIPETYTLLVREGWDRLPECVIGDAYYEISFHAGEGSVPSFIAAIGTSEQEVRKLLQKALKNINAQYVSNETERRAYLRYKVREGD